VLRKKLGEVNRDPLKALGKWKAAHGEKWGKWFKGMWSNFHGVEAKD